MSKTVVKNLLVDGAVTLPSPYNRILQSGDSVVIGDTPANVTAKLGGGAAISRCLSITSALDTATSDIAANGSVADAQMFPIDNAPAKGTTNVHAAVQESAANAFPGPFTSPTVPRNLRVVFAAGWQGGDVTVLGTDQFDNAISEVFTAAAGTTVVGVKIFKTVSAASKGAIAGTTDAASIGTGDKLGVTPMMSAAQAILFTAGAIEAATVDATVSGFTPTTVPDGAVDYLFVFNA